VAGLGQAKSVVFDPTDDSRIYVAAYDDDVVRAFDANTGPGGNGALTAGACVARDCSSPPGLTDCTQVDGLRALHQLAMSADGAWLFAASRESSSLAWIETSTLSPGMSALSDCIQDASVPSSLCWSQDVALLNAHSVAVFDDSIYVTTHGDDSLVHLTFEAAP
jgi:hypothetical protein